uniref:Uncharacterized protein n=1 Tax=Sphaerodactylus townsendi TaxID=933632 RepID=A0ACB8F6X6_9SAUR
MGVPERLPPRSLEGDFLAPALQEAMKDGMPLPSMMGSSHAEPAIMEILPRQLMESNKPPCTGDPTGWGISRMLAKEQQARASQFTISLPLMLNGVV